MCWGTACWATCALGSERTCTSLGQPLARAVWRAQLVLIGGAQRKRTHVAQPPAHCGVGGVGAGIVAAVLLEGDQWSPLIDDHWSAHSWGISNWQEGHAIVILS